MIMMRFFFLSPLPFARIVVYNSTRDCSHAAQQHPPLRCFTIRSRSALPATAFYVCLSQVVLDTAAAMAVGGMEFAVKF
jgi:hypothetical protein